MNSILRKTLTWTAAMAALAGAVSTASAETTWQKKHPARTHVNHRLSHQNRRIHQDVHNGTLTHAQAQQLHHEDHQVRQEERDMASQNGTHLTKPERHALNQQENAVSSQIPPK